VEYVAEIIDLASKRDLPLGVHMSYKRNAGNYALSWFQMKTSILGTLLPIYLPVCFWLNDGSQYRRH